MFNIEFLSLAAKLKITRRHSWPEGLEGPRESVADHSWRLITMIMLYSEKLDQKIDVLKAIEMAAIHDLPEAITGDIPVMNQTEKSKQQKIENEFKAMNQILSLLGEQERERFSHIYDQYEKQVSYEAKVVKALDKLEAFQQHNLDPLNTWVRKEKLMFFQDQYLRKHCSFDSFLLGLANKVLQDGIQKLIDANENIEEIKIEAQNE